MSEFIEKKIQIEINSFKNNKNKEIISDSLIKKLKVNKKNKNNIKFIIKNKYIKDHVTEFFILIFLFFQLIALIITKRLSITITIYGEGTTSIIGEASEFPNPNYLNVNGDDMPPIGGHDSKFISFGKLPKSQYVVKMGFDKKGDSFKYLFSGMDNLIKVDFSEFDTSNIKDMSGMFQNCVNLNEITYGEFDTSNVKTMEHMFTSCSFTELKLPKFKTDKLKNMKAMFSECRQLKSIDLSNIEISSVTSIESLFAEDTSLEFANLISFVENKDIVVNNMFKNHHNNLVVCINEEKAPKIKQEIIKNSLTICQNSDDINNEANENEDINTNIKVTISDTNSEYLEKIDRTTEITENTFMTIETLTEKKTENIIEDNFDKNTQHIEEETINDKTIKVTEEKYNENSKSKNNNILMNNCTAEEFFKGKCGIENEKLSTENKDNLINNIISNIINGNLSSLLTEITEEGKDFFIQEDDIIFQITTTDNQKNNEYNNISSINIGECEGILKQKYNINQNLSLIILKVDYFIPGLLIPVIGYEVFHPLNNSKLNLKYCNNCSINYNIPVSIDENNIDKYDPNSAYYNDECSTYTTEDGTDITLNDRQNEYNENNMSLCENNCNFTEYDKETKKSICMCEIKSKIYSISEIIHSKENVLENFNNDNSPSKTNVNIMKCYNALFSKYGLLKNIGNYILLFIIIVFAISSVIFYKMGYNILDNEIKEIISSKEKKEDKITIFKHDIKKASFSKKKNKK